VVAEHGFSALVTFARNTLAHQSNSTRCRTDGMATNIERLGVDGRRSRSWCSGTATSITPAASPDWPTALARRGIAPGSSIGLESAPLPLPDQHQWDIDVEIVFPGGAPPPETRIQVIRTRPTLAADGRFGSDHRKVGRTTDFERGSRTRAWRGRTVGADPL